MADARKRRWLRFSLRGMLLAVTLLAVWLGWNASIVHKRKAMLAKMAEADVFLNHRINLVAFAKRQTVAKLLFTSPQATIRWMLGDSELYAIGFPRGYPQHEMDTAAKLFPEAKLGVFENEFTIKFFRLPNGTTGVVRSSSTLRESD